MTKIIGNTVGLPNPNPDWNQTDPTKADYIKNKPSDLGGGGIACIDLTTDDEAKWSELPDLSNEILNYGIYQVRWTSSDYLGREVAALVICSSDPAGEILYLFYEAFVYVMPMGMGEDWQILSCAYTLPEKNKLNALPTNEKLTEELSSKVPIIRIEDPYDEIISDTSGLLDRYTTEGVYAIIQETDIGINTWMLHVYNTDYNEVYQSITSQIGTIHSRSQSQDMDGWSSWKQWATYFAPSQNTKLNALPTNEELTAELSSKVPIIRIYDQFDQIVSDDFTALEEYTDTGVYNIIQKTDMEEKSWMLFVAKYEDYEVYQYLVSSTGYVYYRVCVWDVWEGWQLTAASFSPGQRNKLDALPTNAQLNKKFEDLENQIGDIESALDEIHSYAQGLKLPQEVENEVDEIIDIQNDLMGGGF